MKSYNRIYRVITSIALITFSLSSCVKMKMEQTYTTQSESIDKYAHSIMESNDTTAATITYNNGSCRITTVQGTGEPLKLNGTISFYYAGYSFKGNFSKENLFCTNYDKVVSEAQWSKPEEELVALTVTLEDAEILEGLKNGLVGVRAGEECEILFSGKYGFGKKPFGIIPANSALLYRIWVLSISNE